MSPQTQVLRVRVAFSLFDFWGLILPFVFVPKKSVRSVLSLTSPLSSSVAVNVPLPSLPGFGQYLITFQPLCVFHDPLFSFFF